MNKSIDVIYLTGLGDHTPWGQDKLVKLWRLYGLKVHYFPIGWSDGEVFIRKLQHICVLIDKLSKNGDKVAIVGVSAGGSAAVNAYMERKSKISAVVFICGKLRGYKTVNRRYFDRNPAFEDALRLSEEHLKALNSEDKAKMLCLKSAHDGLVPARDSVIEGTVIKTIPMIWHLPSIFFAITAGTPTIARFIKSRNS